MAVRKRRNTTAKVRPAAPDRHPTGTRQSPGCTLLRPAAPWPTVTRRLCSAAELPPRLTGDDTADDDDGDSDEEDEDDEDDEDEDEDEDEDDDEDDEDEGEEEEDEEGEEEEDEDLDDEDETDVSDEGESVHTQTYGSATVPG